MPPGSLPARFPVLRLRSLSAFIRQAGKDRAPRVGLLYLFNLADAADAAADSSPLTAVCPSIPAPLLCRATDERIPLTRPFLLL